MKSRGKRKIRTGRVVSSAMDKSAVIKVERRLRHPLFGRVIRSTSKIMAHDERNELNVGDLVQVTETRPMSKRKRWRLVKVLEKAK